MAFRKDPYNNSVINEIAKEEGLDRRVVALVAAHPFFFLAKMMRDKIDLKPIMFRYLGKFAIRGGQEKKK